MAYRTEAMGVWNWAGGSYHN